MNLEIEPGHLSACLPHLANTARATGRTLTFDPATETFQNDAEANALLTPIPGAVWDADALEPSLG